MAATLKLMDMIRLLPSEGLAEKSLHSWLSYWLGKGVPFALQRRYTEADLEKLRAWVAEYRLIRYARRQKRRRN